MSSVSSQPQFRYTQPPSKVLHLRNLPWECTEEELIELGKPFGKVVNTKCNVGANRNQAFIEFVSEHRQSQPPPKKKRKKRKTEKKRSVHSLGSICLLQLLHFMMSSIE